MSYPQPPPFPPGQGPQWQGGGYAQQHSPAPPPPPKNSAGIAVVVVGGVVIIVLVVAIVLVFTLGGSGSGGTPAADSPRPQESTSDRTPEDDDTSTPDVLGDDSEWIPDDIPDDVPETPDGGLTAGEFPEDMDGDWKGTMTQYDLEDGSYQSTWTLDVHMAAGESTGSAELSLENGRSCQWDIITTDNTEDTVDLEYHTTDDGNGNCTPFGYLHFIVDGDDLYVGVASEQPDGSISTADGVLSRY